MGVLPVASASVTNGTAGTSVVVSRPTGTENGHVLVAFVTCVGNATISTPSGWMLIGTANPSALVRLNAFWKVASSEPSSWTWTLGSSQRNLGWVGAYSGVNTSDPIFDSASSTGDGTAFNSLFNGVSLAIHRLGGRVVDAVAGVRTASGAATTWTPSIFDTERADLSTNAGAGTDIAGSASDRANDGFADVGASIAFTASQAQTVMAGWGVALRPAFTGYDGGEIKPVVEAAFGADPDGDPDDWTWTDITADAVDVGTRAVVSAGVDDRGGIDQEAAPTKIAFRLVDTTGKYIPGNANGAHYPNVVEQVPVRVRVPFGYTPPTTLATAFVDRWTPTWDDNGVLAFVDVTATGRLQSTRDSGHPIHSVLRREITGGFASGVIPHAYYPCEDQSGSSRVASAFPGHQPLQVSGPVSFAADSGLGGSQALPTLGVDGVLGGALGPGQALTGQWAVLAAIKLPDTPVAVASRIMLVVCTGSAREWTLWMVPGSPHTLNIRASHFGTSLVDDAVSVVEAEHYGQWRLYVIGVAQSGADVEYQSWSLNATDGVGKAGTLAGRTIGVAHTGRFVGTSSLDGMALGHVALYTDPAFDLDSDPAFIAAAALEGRNGDHPISRFLSLCDREGIPGNAVGTISGSTSIGMGPQPAGRIGDLLQQAGDTDHGLIHDGTPDGAVTLVSRASMYNKDPELVLDNRRGQVPVGLRPTADSQGRITDSTVTRDGGSSARYVDPGARGSKPDAKTLSLETDRHLYEIAGWRVTLGSQPGLRYSQVPLNLLATPTLTEAWMRTAIGSRVQAINLPATHGPKDADGILVGWRQEISADRWMVYMNLAPARPYDVPVMESGDDTAWRLDTGGSELAAAATSSATSLLVATTGETLWTTDGGNYPQDFDVNGERVTASSVTSAVRDTFSRSVTDGWSTSDSGHVWTNSGGVAADYDINGSKGLHTHPSTNVIHHSYVDSGVTDHAVRVYLNLGAATLATAGATAFVLVRMADTSNWYAARIGYATTGVVTLQLAEMVLGAGALVGSASWSLGTIANYGTTQLIVQVWAKGTSLYAKAWDATTTEPLGWHVFETDGSLTAGTLVGVASRRDTGNTDANLVFAWDNFALLNPQIFTVTRGVAGGATAKAHAIGAPVKLWRGRGLAL